MSVPPSDAMSVPPPEDDRRSVVAWLETWAGHVRAVDYAAARPLFAKDLLGFGSHEPVMRGLAEVEARQWRIIWPHTRGFRFRTEELVLVVSADRRLATVMVPWESTGCDPASGEPFDRPGRATIVLERTDPDAPWQGLHTHFSLAPGTPRGTRIEGSPDQVVDTGRRHD